MQGCPAGRGREGYSYGLPPNHLFLAYFPKDSATATLRRGDELLVSTRLVPPANNGNPDEFDYARYLRRKGYSGTAYVADGHWRKTGHDASRTVSQVALDYRRKWLAYTGVWVLKLMNWRYLLR